MRKDKSGPWRSSLTFMPDLSSSMHIHTPAAAFDPDMSGTPRFTAPRRQAWVLPLVLLLHALVLIALYRSQLSTPGLRPTLANKEPARMQLYIVAEAPPRTRGPEADLSPARQAAKDLPPTKATPRRNAEDRPSRDASRPDNVPLTSSPSTASPEAGRSAVVQAETAGAAASAPGPRERLIDTAATQHALKTGAREPLTKERLGVTSGTLDTRTASERLGRDMQKGAHGDCAKGEFAGGGLGLLSAPFFLLAEATGKCGRGITPVEAQPQPAQPPLYDNAAHSSTRGR